MTNSALQSCCSKNSKPEPAAHPLLGPRSRRQFVRQFAILAATSYAAKNIAHSQLLAQIAPAATATSTDGIIRLRISDFFVLQSDGGSVRVGVNLVGSDAFPEGQFYPILINRLPGANFIALSAQCRHANCAVQAFDDLDQGMRCPCHNSLYTLEGLVRRGPANRALSRYALAVESTDVLAITVPGLGFTITATPLNTQGVPHLRLTFPTIVGIQYEVLASNQADNRGTPIQFALADNVTPSETVVSGTGSEVSVYPDTSSAQPATFYSVRMVVNEV